MNAVHILHQIVPVDTDFIDLQISIVPLEDQIQQNLGDVCGLIEAQRFRGPHIATDGEYHVYFSIFHRIHHILLVSKGSVLDLRLGVNLQL